MGPALLEQEGYMESNRERFRLRNGMPYIGAAVDGTTSHISPIQESRSRITRITKCGVPCYALELSTLAASVQQ